MGTYPVRIVDTTAPTFTLVPVIVGLRDGCVTAYLPQPSVLDNSYLNNRLTLTKSHPDGPEDQVAHAGTKAASWKATSAYTVRRTIADPQGNSRSTNMRVEVRRRRSPLECAPPAAELKLRWAPTSVTTSRFRSPC